MTTTIRSNKNLSRGLAGLGLALACASTVAAGLSFDPATGTGLVPKSAVSGAYGWNNTTLQANANGTTFSVDTTTNYAATCTVARDKRVENQVRMFETTSGRMLTAVRSDDPRTRQLVRWDLTGYGTTLFETGNLPVIGTRCAPAPGFVGLWTGVEAVSQSGDYLFAHYGAERRQLSF